MMVMPSLALKNGKLSSSHFLVWQTAVLPVRQSWFVTCSSINLSISKMRFHKVYFSALLIEMASELCFNHSGTRQMHKCG